jgi:hypothetical protein
MPTTKVRTATSWHRDMGAGAADRGMQRGSLGGRLGGALCQPGGFGARGRVPTTIQSGAAGFTSADMFGGGGGGAAGPVACCGGRWVWGCPVQAV